MAPFIPFLSENMYQNLVRSADADAPESVHMTEWPVADASWQNDDLLFEIDVVQKVVGLARAARGRSGVRTRQPLARLLIRAPNDAAAKALDSHQDQILEELNVKSIEFIARDAGLVSYTIKPNLPKLGREGHGKDLPDIRKALNESDGAAIASAAARNEPIVINVPSGELRLTGEDVLIETSSAEGYSCEADSGYLTALDTTLNDALINEGFARELVRSIQDARKQAGLEVSDRITLGVSGTDAVERALEVHRGYIMSETLATSWEVGQPKPLYSDNKSLGEDNWTIEITL
jgi:isoleucyl-tRNA synthetase